MQRIVDGDTIVVQRPGHAEPEKVRIACIDTPETKDPRRPVERYGAEAAAFTAGLLPIGARVELEVDTEQADVDRFGRLIRYVNVAGADIGLEVVSRGYGHAWSGGACARKDAYRAAETAAREALVGLWAP